MKTNANDTAWAAGYFEGEGALILRRAQRTGYRAHLELNITSTDRDVLDRFALTHGILTEAEALTR